MSLNSNDSYRSQGKGGGGAAHPDPKDKTGREINLVEQAGHTVHPIQQVRKSTGRYCIAMTLGRIITRAQARHAYESMSDYWKDEERYTFVSFLMLLVGWVET